MPGRVLTAAVIGLATMGCGGKEPDTLSNVHQAVLFGEASGPEEAGVVLTRGATQGVTRTCTGTLVAPNLVLTARHCISNYDDATFTCTALGELDPDSKGGIMGPAVEPENVAVYVGLSPDFTGADPDARGAEVFVAQTPTICRNDIALVVLDTDLGDLPVSAIRLDRGTDPGERIRVVGYGSTEEGGFGTRRTRSGLEIAKVGTSQFREEGDPIPPRTFTTEGPALCGGDSGGPALSEQGAVIGVWSQVAGECTASTAVNYFTELAPFRAEIIDPAFEAAGHEPLLEVRVAPGQAGAAGAQMGSAGADNGRTAGSAGAASRDPTIEVAGAAGAEGIPYRGPRKKGGCTCRAAGATPATPGAPWLSFLALVLARQRRRNRRSTGGTSQPRAVPRGCSRGTALALRLRSCSTCNSESMS